MAKTKNPESKRKWNIWKLIFIALGMIIVTSIGSCIALCCLSQKSTLWVTFLCAVTTAASSLLVGLIAFWQNKQMKELADAKDALTREENEKQRRQDLLIRTNPKAVFEKVEDIVFVRESGFRICDYEKINRLTEHHFTGVADFGQELSMNLIFSTNSNVDSICVTNLVISKVLDDFWPVKTMRFINPSKTPYGQLKVVSDNKVKLYVQLLWDKLNQKGFVEGDKYYPLDDLAEAKNIWSVTLTYTAGNDFSGAHNQYQTQFYFKNLSGDKNEYDFLKGTPDDKPLDIEIIENKTTTWIIKEETSNGQTEDDVDEQSDKR